MERACRSFFMRFHIRDMSKKPRRSDCMMSYQQTVEMDTLHGLTLAFVVNATEIISLITPVFHIVKWLIAPSYYKILMPQK